MEDFNVSIGDSGSLMTESAPGNHALDAARAVLTDIATNPANPRHSGYHRGDSQVSAYLDQLYKNATAPGTLDQGITVTGRDESPSREDSVAHSEIDTMLRQTLGESYDVEMRDMRLGGGYLFSTQETQALFEKLSPLITDLGPLAEMLGIRFLADLGRLAKQQGGRSR